MASRTLGVITVILVLGTLYSVRYNTYLDTSDPLLTHLPHPLSNSHFFANKANPLNVILIKRAWGWTSSAFLLLWFTSPPRNRTQVRLAKYLTLTLLWVLFTSWFFGPALLERVNLATGGECVVALPANQAVGVLGENGGAAGGVVVPGPITVPAHYCHTRTPVAPHTHPDLFIPSSSSFISSSLPEGWKALPRLRKGHDVSGHVFLLTMSALFLADQLKLSFLPGGGVGNGGEWDLLHLWAVILNLGLLALWFFAIGTTSVYFHSPSEKFTGYLLGVAAFSVTKLKFWDSLFPRETDSNNESSTTTDAGSAGSSASRSTARSSSDKAVKASGRSVRA